VPKLFQSYLFAFALAALGCSASVKPDISTETGNPPVIDSSKIALVVTRDEVHVQGDAGAIMPPEAEVEITIVRTQDVTIGEVEDDGSFDVPVEATFDDVFEVRALLDGERSDVVIVDRGGAMVGEGSGGSSLSCEQQLLVAGTVLDSAMTAADRSCEIDADCMLFVNEDTCAKDCSYAFVSEAGLQSLRDTAASVDDAVCATFVEDGCELQAPLTCVQGSIGTCNAGQCERREPPSCEDDCIDSLLAWRTTSAGTLPALPANERRTISACNELTLTTDAGSCATDVSHCESASMASIQAINTAIASDEVQTALEQGGFHGEPEDTAGFWYELTIGSQTFTYRTCASQTRAGCLPRGPIDQLIELLDRIQEDNSCTIAADCTSPFDSGMCDGAFAVWWHDPASGACIPQSYGGCDGNANRYETEEDCLAACPPPSTEGDCPAGRQLHLGCFQCGVIGGCMEERNFCALECDSDEDCSGERGTRGGATMCEETTGTCRDVGSCL
jgi:hypothetical protein